MDGQSNDEHDLEHRAHIGPASHGLQLRRSAIATTGGSVFEDLDGDGIKDEGEPGIADVTVTLTGTSVVTGGYRSRPRRRTLKAFTHSATSRPARTRSSRRQPGNFVDGKEQNGTPAATVSNDRFAGINLTTSAATSGGFNFGEVKGATIAGIVYDDVNDDGAEAATGEVGITGVTIRLQGTNDLGQTVNTTQTTGETALIRSRGCGPARID